MDFGQAVLTLKKGYKITRSDWGNNQFLLLINPDNYSVKVRIDIDEGPLLPFIGMKTVDNQFIPWLPNQIDLLADDWKRVV